MNYSMLAQSALQARQSAYAPYSHFTVGAALLCADGAVYTGSNIENGAFTPSNCAERTAFFTAIHAGHRTFTAIAIAGAEETQPIPQKLCPPCGVCLQVMAEFCDPQTFEIILVKSETEFEVHPLCELLPFGFRL